MADLLAIRIQHHPSRAELLPRLLARLRDYSDLRVIPDPGWEGKPNAWRAHRACLEAMSAEADHLLVLQDDALILDGFPQTLEDALRDHPESLVSLFAPGFRWIMRQMLQAQKAHHRYLLLSVGAFAPTVAILYPRAIVEDMLVWVESQSRVRLGVADDGVVAAYCRRRRILPLVTIPNVVQHDDQVATVGKRVRPGPHRRAALI